MPRIVQLSDAVANQIAAGEVIERPASVVKELLENAVDAEARRVEVEITGGGIQLIRVTDDGLGMEPADARLCLSRHATSKLESAADLELVATLGFRGEAIPSIASVSHFALVTRPHDAAEGTKVMVEGGAAPSVTPIGAAPGTSIEVRELFYNVPARRKFLKRPATEMSHITDAVERVALAHPAMSFKLITEGRTVLDIPPVSDADPRGWLGRVLGRTTAKHLYPVPEDATRYRPIRVRGWAGAPELNERTTRGVHTFVNGRYVKDRTIQHAITESYRGLVRKGRHPVVVLWLDVDPTTVDVNVHPQKTEVRFSRSSDVHRSVTAALGAVLEAQPWLTGVVAPRDGAAAVNDGEAAADGPPTMDTPPGSGLDEHRARLAAAAKALGRDRQPNSQSVWSRGSAPRPQATLPFEATRGLWSQAPAAS